MPSPESQTVIAAAWPRTRQVPNLTAFAASAAIMLVELSAGALVSRHLGMSLQTWTAIIGVVMAGMAIGNAIGGRIADRAPALKGLAGLFLLAALGCAAILPLNALAGAWLAPMGLAWPLRIALHVTIVFLLPAVTLGSVTPVVAKLALQVGDESGKTVGALFAWGVAGSIVGTFLTGFYLVYALGVTELMAGSAGVLGLLGLFFAFMAMRHGAANAVSTGTATAYAQAGPSRSVWLGAYATVFLSNALFMMLELAASRVLSRQFGSSIYTWTAVIGIFLAGITAGNYLGGRLADRAGIRIATIFVLASVLAFLSPLLNLAALHALNTWLWLGMLPWPWQIALHLAVAFFAPCVAIGMVSPVVVKHLFDAGAQPGRSIGGVYAVGSAGAIAGTFATGYALLDWMGSHPVLGLVSAGLGIVGACHARGMKPAAWAALCTACFVLALLPQQGARNFSTWLGLRHATAPLTIYEDESNYSYIAVRQDGPNPRKRQMYLDKLMHSTVDLDNPRELKYEYGWIYDTVLGMVSPPGTPVSVLALGGGGFVFPHYLELTRPGSYIETAEIDPAVTEAAHAAFGFPRDTSVQVYNMDARNRVDDLVRAKAKGEKVPEFDCVLGDSISDFIVPRHLTTLEFAQQVDSLINPDGIYLLNLIEKLDSGLFLGAIVSTLKEVFPQVEVYNTGRPSAFRDTFVVICSKVPRDFSGLLAELQKTHDYKGRNIDLDALLTPERRMVLTDNYAPVELLLQPVVATRQQDRGSAIFADAIAAMQANNPDRALELAAQSLRYGYEWPAVYELQAQIYFLQGKSAEHIAALRKALPNNPKPGIILASLGVALLSAGQSEEGYKALMQSIEEDDDKVAARTRVAKLAMKDNHLQVAVDQWQALTTLEPESANTRYNLGLAQAGLQQYGEAIDAWRQAIKLDPKHYDSYHNLALALHLEKRDDEARQVLADLRAQGGTPDPKLEAELAVKPAQ